MFGLVLVVVVLPDVGDVLEEQHGEDVVFVDAGVHRATEGVAGVPDGGINIVLLNGEAIHICDLVHWILGWKLHRQAELQLLPAAVLDSE